MNLDDQWENFKLFGLIYWVYPKKFELFWAWLLKKRVKSSATPARETWKLLDREVLNQEDFSTKAGNRNLESRIQKANAERPYFLNFLNPQILNRLKLITGGLSEFRNLKNRRQSHNRLNAWPCPTIRLEFSQPQPEKVRPSQALNSKPPNPNPE